MPFPDVFFAPIPRLLWSDYLDAPFVQCIDCEQPLLESSVFVINKRFVAGETIFEMAMCNRCREAFALEYSEETKAAIAEFFRQHFGRNRGDSEEELTGEALVEYCMNHCCVCDVHRDKCHRYSIAGLCRELDIIAQISSFGQTPLMICEKCEGGMEGLVSAKTRESWDRFIEEHFDGPPGIEMDSPSAYPVTF
jgi:hypothetical protein